MVSLVSSRLTLLARALSMLATGQLQSRQLPSNVVDFLGQDFQIHVRGRADPSMPNGSGHHAKRDIRVEEF